MADRIRRSLAERLPPQRFVHVMGVEGLAVHLAHRWGVDPEKVLLAALLHDYLKNETTEQLEGRLGACEDFLPTEEDRKHPAVWHGIAAATIAKSEFGIEDRDIREAIFYHTTGVDGLGPVGICLYVADTLEPTRRFRGVEEKRRAILPLGMYEAARETARIKLQLLERKHRMIHSQTLRMKEWLEDSP